MKTLYKFSMFLLALTLSLSAISQDVRYTQVLNNPMRVNPALTSHSNDMRAMLTHRSQWEEIGGGLITPSFTFVYPIFLQKDKWSEQRGNAKLDLGLNVISEQIGAYSKIDAMLSVSAALRLSKHQYMSVAIYGGYVQKALELEGLTFDEQYHYGNFDPSMYNGESLISETVQYPDAGFGMSWSYSPQQPNPKLKAYAGLSAFHLNQYNASMTDAYGKVPVLFSAQAGVQIPADKSLELGMHMIYRNQSQIDQLCVGLLAGSKLNDKSKLVYGIWYKQKEAFAVQLGYTHQRYLFAMSYDFITSEVANSFNNVMTYELSLAYKLNLAKRKNFVNPVFF